MYKKYALILTVENDNDAINNRRMDLPFRYYEKESIECIKHWRENGGWLKDIPIYIVNPTGNVSINTLNEYKKYSISYINNIHGSNSDEYGFMNVHYSGHYLETLSELTGTLLIHIDLDMYLLRPFPENFFDDIWEGNYDAFLGGYFKEDYKSQRVPLYTEELTNTGFICNIAGKFNFYEKILNHFDTIEDEYKKIKNLRTYDKEEYCSDLLSKLYNIKIINGYEQGEGYSVSSNISNVFFWHEHIYKTNDIKLKIQKFKLKKELSEFTF